jgi:hypothetical protein
MSEQPPLVSLGAVDPRYVAARRILLDALSALEPHRHAIIVAGAQAIYLRTGSADMSITVAPFTTDGDLALDPSHLGDKPALEAAMTAAGFSLAPLGDHVEPGIWVKSTEVGGLPFDVPVDLIVPEAANVGGGRRGARLGPHGNRAARRAVGLEAALVDHSEVTITALEEGDGRSVVANVAGAAALLVAKLHKLHDRVAEGSAERLNDKDAGDVIRVMQSTSAHEVGTTLARLQTDELAGPVTSSALDYIDDLFGRRGGPGIQMAARALRLGIPEERVQALSVAYTAVLLQTVSRPGS